MKQFLEKIRKPDTACPLRARLILAVGVIVLGFGLGVLQKWLDSLAVNELPLVFQQLDITNYFGRPAVWILLATVIAVYASHPLQASVNTFLFFISMLAGYYLYCHFVLGFLPKAYMLMWLAIACVTPLLAYICWYARGEGAAAVVITAGILGVLFSQAFLLLQGFRVAYVPEILTWLAALVVLRRKPKELAAAVGLSLVVAVIWQLLVPYGG